MNPLTPIISAVLEDQILLPVIPSGSSLCVWCEVWAHIDCNFIRGNSLRSGFMDVLCRRLYVASPERLGPCNVIQASLWTTFLSSVFLSLTDSMNFVKSWWESGCWVYGWILWTDLCFLWFPSEAMPTQASFLTVLQENILPDSLRVSSFRGPELMQGFLISQPPFPGWALSFVSSPLRVQPCKPLPLGHQRYDGICWLSCVLLQKPAFFWVDRGTVFFSTAHLEI